MKNSRNLFGMMFEILAMSVISIQKIDDVVN